jgi:hypothetical protein
MSFAEFKLLLILLFVFVLCISVLHRNIILTLRAFLLFSAMGFVVQLLLGRELNRYTPNITLYIFYVSYAVIIAWGTSLSFIWALHSYLVERFKISSGLATYTLCGFPILILLEIIGSNVLKMKLHNYHQYAAILPSLNTMHAPKWLFVFYILVAFAQFYVSKALGLYSVNFKGSLFGKFSAISHRENLD